MRSFEAGQQETVVHGKQLPEKINHLSRWTAPGTSIPVAAYLVLRLRPQASSLIVLFSSSPVIFLGMGLDPPPLPQIVSPSLPHHRHLNRIPPWPNFSSQSVLMLSWAQPIHFGCLNKSLLLYGLGFMPSLFSKPYIRYGRNVPGIHSNSSPV